MPWRRIPLFPLDAVLYPGTPLPLHIFEPRYREMLRVCLAGSRMFGIVPPGTEREAPHPGAVGCIAEIRASEELADGRSNIVVVGGSRFFVREVSLEGAPYLVGTVEEFDDAPGPGPSADSLDELRAQFARYHRAQRELRDAEPDEPSLPEEPAALTFAVAAALDAEPTVKRRLLALRSAGERVHLLLRLLPALTAAVTAALGVHRRARRNGKGGAPVLLPPES